MDGINNATWSQTNKNRRDDKRALRRSASQMEES